MGMIMRAIHVLYWTLAGVLMLAATAAAIATVLGRLELWSGFALSVVAFFLCAVCAQLADVTDC